MSYKVVENYSSAHAVELNIAPQTAFFIVMKAREFAAKAANENAAQGSNASDDKNVAVLAQNGDDSAYQELIEVLSDLNEDEQIDLVTLAWVGRGDFSIAEWDEAREEVSDMHFSHIPTYLSETPLLSDYLEDGLSDAGYALGEFKAQHL